MSQERVNETAKRKHKLGPSFYISDNEDGPFDIPVYTAPPKREWVGLTDEEITDLWAGVSGDDEISIWKLGHAIEAKLKEKNT